MGTAYGVWSSFVACNNILLEVTAGAIVSHSLDEHITLTLTPLALALSLPY